MKDKIVYLIHHTSINRDNDDDENVKLIGVFSSKKNAIEAIEKLKLQPGFKDEIDNFSTDEYTVNEICWSEGFIKA